MHTRSVTGWQAITIYSSLWLGSCRAYWTLPTPNYPSYCRQSLVSQQNRWWSFSLRIFWCQWWHWWDSARHNCPHFDRGGFWVVLLIIYSDFCKVECCLDEWVTGEREDVDFSANTYTPKYEQHLARLKDFDAKTRVNKIMPRLCQHLLANAKYVLFLPIIRCQCWY